MLDTGVPVHIAVVISKEYASLIPACIDLSSLYVDPLYLRDNIAELKPD
jgi:hypothetical protein